VKVTIRDRRKEDAAWGSPGLFQPMLRTVEISDQCPVCGGPRGVPARRPFHEDGVSFSVDCWNNPCGHIDRYADVIQESEIGTTSDDEINEYQRTQIEPPEHPMEILGMTSQEWNDFCSGAWENSDGTPVIL
jgi:hypothetical protein